MARPQNRKRPLADDLSQDSPRRKKIKSERYRDPSNFSPAFWDNLSKVWLTPRALRELDRRNSARTPAKPTTPEKVNSDALASVKHGDPGLRKFARHGGPDLRDLRGCPAPGPNTMASEHSSASSRPTPSTDATSTTSKTRRSSAYNDDFEQHLCDNRIYLPQYGARDNRRPAKPDNLHDLLPRLSTSRPSLSPSRFDESAFEDFQQKNETRSEGTVMRNVVPMIAGNPDIPNEGHLPFTNLASMTDETTVKLVPDFFDGARAGDVHAHVRRDLDQEIIPTRHMDVPVAPNFYLEAKGPKGGADVARRQACYDGAHGARAMHSLQNYGQAEVDYDNNAYTFSSTYCAGTLSLYAHHVAAPAVANELPEYHMTQLDSFAMTGKPKTYIEGVTAFRNSRDLAQEYRDRFIQEANSRAREEGIPYAEPEDASSPEEFVDCEEYLGPHNIGHSEYPNTEVCTNDMLDSSQASITTSFTASHNLSQPHTKRQRQSSTPPSTPRDGETGKSRRPPNSLTRVDNKSAHGTRPETSGSDESTWVGTYKRQGHVYFINLQEQEIRTSRKDWNGQQVDGVGRCHYWQSPKSGHTFWTRELP
ncbi:hypothetical protein PG985_004822 [Apiospora marii]|uniref:uncharacterized protein n=1 Tax=Apiospora marii TaxID=335849 RepID=UPI00312DE48A